MLGDKLDGDPIHNALLYDGLARLTGIFKKIHSSNKLNLLVFEELKKRNYLLYFKRYVKYVIIKTLTGDLSHEVTLFLHDHKASLGSVRPLFECLAVFFFNLVLPESFCNISNPVSVAIAKYSCV